MATTPTQPAAQDLFPPDRSRFRSLRLYPPNRQTLAHLWQEHGIAWLLYLMLAFAVTWPLARDFTTLILDDGGDAQNNLWTYWHLAQWVQGNEPLFSTRLLFYPYGLSILLHGVGPVIGALSLPFWPLGPEAAYNGALLLGLTLTGYTMYRLARALQLDRAIALFAGAVLMTSAMPLAGLRGHSEKVFLAGLPLTALTLHHALNPKRSGWWAVATALSLLLTLLSSGYQFVYAAFLVAFFVVALGLATPAAQRRAFGRRVFLVAVSAMVLVGPFILAILHASADPLLLVSLSNEAGQPWNHPDLLQFLLPPIDSRLFGSVNQPIAEQFPSIWYGIETNVSLPWAGIFLCLFAAFGRGGAGRRWVLFLLLCLLLALGPSLKVLGATAFGEFGLSIPLPYRLLAELPGVGFMRTPARFMKVAYVAFALVASFGLSRLVNRFPRYRGGLIIGAMALMLIPNWPNAWPQQALPIPPPFYQQLGAERDEYAVYDLPLKANEGAWYEWNYLETSRLYQTYQMTHGKPIAGGYLSRVYHAYPNPFRFMSGISAFPPDIFVNGERANQYTAAQEELARRNYRYVVWHKEILPGTPGQATAQQFIQAAFAGQAPLLEDERTAVYRVSAQRDVIAPTIALGDNWQLSPLPRRALSPATVYVESPQPQQALLRIQPRFMHDPQSTVAPGIGESGRLHVQIGDLDSRTAEIQVERVTAIPLVLPAGRHAMTLTLESGNLDPARYGNTDENAKPWSFEIRSMELQTLEDGTFPQGTSVNGQPQSHNAPLKLFLGSGWYGFEPEMGSRWGSSPAELLIHSDAARQVRLEWLTTLLHVPDAANGLGTNGQMLVTINDAASQTVPVQAGQKVTVPLELQQGWNRVTLQLEAGSFQPAQRQEGGDRRFLSFNVTNVNVTTP